MKDFFISYNKADRSWAEWIAWQLEEAGYKTVIQSWDFAVGCNFAVEMHRAAIETSHTILVLSPDFLSSGFTQAEWTAAFVQDPTGSVNRLVPVRVRKCDPPGMLKAVVYVDLVDREEVAARSELLALIKGALRHAAGERPSKPAQAPFYPAAATTKQKPAFPTPAGHDAQPAKQPFVIFQPPANLERASRSPVVIAVQQADEPIAETDLRPIERHLTVTLSREQLEELSGLCGCAAGENESLHGLLADGERAWDILDQAQPRIRSLLDTVKASVNSQPIAWTGPAQLLVRIHRALLIAKPRGAAAPEGFLSVGFGDHYFNPLPPGDSQRTVQPCPTGRLRATILKQDEAPADNGVRAAAAAPIVVFRGPASHSRIAALAESMASDHNSNCRVALAFGEGDVPAEALQSALARLPCLSLGGARLDRDDFLQPLADSLAAGAARLAVPTLLAAYRREWIRLAIEAGDTAALRDGLHWTTWSWIGRPLFAADFGVALPAVCPHLTDLRSVAAKEWYFNRRKGIPGPYEAEALKRDDAPATERFHLYLSGAGGTGKSCFLRFIYEDLLEKSNVVPVWYRVDAPSCGWDNVQRRIKEETAEAVKRRVGDRAAAVLPRSQVELGAFLRQLATNLRKLDPPVDEVVVFVDQLERTFESGDEPEFTFLETISQNVIDVLKTVKVGQGVRVFIASRKQYLPDFLRSYHDASLCGLHFNVLQPISDLVEQHGFVERVLAYCREKELADETLSIDRRAAEFLAGQVHGHPLDLMLALIQLFTRVMGGRIDEDSIRQLRPWEKLFHFDLQLAAKNDIDWYFLLAMAAARSEIVRFDEVWWRVRLVKASLTRNVEDLGEQGVLERLWLLGHLGRTIHARPGGPRDPVRFLEFFHANLRDYILRDVMSYGGAELGISGRTGGTPPAWRALERLAAAARDWGQTQHALPDDDIRVLMQHRHVVIERPKKIAAERLAKQEEGKDEPFHPPFYLLFLRDAILSRTDLCKAAVECFVFSAVVHDELGRWAFDTLISDPDAKVKCCERWLRRSPPDSRLRLFQYLVERGEPNVRRFVARIVLSTGDSELSGAWREIADVLAEPLYAVRYRREVISSCLEAIAERNEEANIPERFGVFVAASCDRSSSEILAELSHCAERAKGARSARLREYSKLLESGELVESWLRNEQVAGLEVRNRREFGGQASAAIELIAGEELKDALAAALKQNVAGLLEQKLGTPLPVINIAAGEVPPHQVLLRLAGHNVGLGEFYPDRVQVLKRHWDSAGEPLPPGAAAGYDETRQEAVLWISPDALPKSGWEHDAVPALAALTGWLEREVRRNFDLLFDYDLLGTFLREISSAVDLGRVFRKIELRELREVLVSLVMERVPLGERGVEIMEDLQNLPGKAEEVDTPTQRLRERFARDLVRVFWSDSDELPVIVLEDSLEEQLVTRLRPSDTGDFLRLDAAEARSLASAIILHTERNLREEDALPVVVCVAVLRRPLFRLLQRYDRRIYTLSFTELPPEQRVSIAGQVLLSAIRMEHEQDRS